MQWSLEPGNRVFEHAQRAHCQIACHRHACQLFRAEHELNVKSLLPDRIALTRLKGSMTVSQCASAPARTACRGKGRGRSMWTSMRQFSCSTAILTAREISYAMQQLCWPLTRHM